MRNLITCAMAIAMFGASCNMATAQSEAQLIIAEQIEARTQELVIQAGVQYTAGLADAYERLAREAYSNFGRLNGLPATDVDRARLQSFFSQRSRYFRDLSRSSSSVSRFISQNATAIGYGADVVLGAFDEVMLERELDNIRSEFPSLDLSEITFGDHVVGIGASVLNGMSYGVFRVNRTSFEAYDEMPSNSRRLPEWIAAMEEIANSPEIDLYSDGSTPPLGILQYLHARQDALEAVTDQFGLNLFAQEFSWINDWEISNTPGFGTSVSVVPAGLETQQTPEYQYTEYVPFPAQTGWTTQTIELSGASREESLVSYTATNPNTDLTNETTTAIIEEAEPDSPPLWAGRMSLSGRVNAGLNPATGVVETMDASGNAPVSQFILFNPGAGSINTPIRGTQTSVNIGHTFSHLIWGDWSGGSRTWTTSSYPVNELSGFFVYGELTSPDARTTGAATYTGRLRGDIIGDGNIQHGTAYGDFGLTANFGTGSLGGWLAFADTDSSDYAFVSDIENARIVRQSDRLTFSGDLSGEGITGGNIDGYFFGPNATELGGTYDVAGSDGSSSNGILLGWETGTMPGRPENPASGGYPLYVSYSTTFGAIVDRGDDGIGAIPEMGDTLILTVDNTPTRVTEVYDTPTDDFDYTSWGAWTGGAPNSPINEGYWVAGQETPSSVIEARTGSATYSGTIVGDYVSGGVREDAGGSINLTADFSNDRISGDMEFHTATTGMRPIAIESPITNGSFFQSESTYGFQGTFFGPNAEEVGGTAWARTTDGSYNGVFRANQ